MSAAAAVLTAPRQLSLRVKRLTLAACIVGSSAAFLDGTLVNVALPAIRADLHGGLATQQWVIDAYLLTLGALILVGGSLGDVFGRRLIFQLGVAGFGVASVACALAPSAAALVAARSLQGVAGALLVPNTLALIMDTFPKGEQAAAIGAWTAWTGISTVFGPLLGGSLVAAGTWRLIFLVNLPLVAGALWLVRATPKGRRDRSVHVDWIGAALCALGLAGPVFALIEEPTRGWSDDSVALPLAAGLLLLLLFVAREYFARQPMLPLSMFRSRNFRVANLSTVFFYGALSIATFLLVVFLQQVAGYSALAAGAATVPMSIVTFALAKRFGALADRYGPHWFMGGGPVLASIGLLLLSRVGGHPDYLTDIFPGVTIYALGLALTVAPLTAAVLGAAEPGHSGVASGVNTAAARVAGLVAIALVGALLAARFTATLGHELPRSTAAPSALHKTLVVDASGFPKRERPQARNAMVDASIDSYRLGMTVAAALALVSGLVSLGGISNATRSVRARSCPGGAICGASADIGTT